MYTIPPVVWDNASPNTSLGLLKPSTGSGCGIFILLARQPQWSVSPVSSWAKTIWRLQRNDVIFLEHYSDLIMGAMASQIISLAIVYSIVYSKPRVTGLCVGNSPVTGEFPAQMGSNAENVPISDDVIMKSVIENHTVFLIDLPCHTESSPWTIKPIVIIILYLAI